MMNNKRTGNLSVVRDELSCPLCESNEITTTIHEHKFQFGTGEESVDLTVNAAVRYCAACDLEYLDDETERLKHEAVCHHLGVLTPGEVRHIREMNHMSRSKFAQLTGLGEATLNRWENGLNVQTLAYDRYLRLLYRPGALQILEQIVTSYDVGKPSSPDTQFLALNLTSRVLEAQSHFHLRPAA